MERKGPGPTDPLVRAEPPFDWYRTPAEMPRRVETPARTPITLDPDIALWPVTPLSRWPFIGPPTEGMWPVGWMGVDATGTIYTCTVGGEPGTWAAQGGSSVQSLGIWLYGDGSDGPLKFTATPRTVADAVLVPGSDVITSATAAWTGADVGLILDDTAGHGGLIVGLRVKSVTNGTTAVMTGPAGPNATGSADDTVLIGAPTPVAGMYSSITVPTGSRVVPPPLTNNSADPVGVPISCSGEYFIDGDIDLSALGVIPGTATTGAGPDTQTYWPLLGGNGGNGAGNDGGVCYLSRGANNVIRMPLTLLSGFVTEVALGATSGGIDLGAGAPGGGDGTNPGGNPGKGGNWWAVAAKSVVHGPNARYILTGADGETPAAAVAVAVGDGAVSLPLTVVPGTNDELVYTPAGTGVPETFTVAGGTLTTPAAVGAAVGAAIGAAHGEAFSTLVTTTVSGGQLAFAVVATGGAHNGDTITPGANDITADLRLDNPTTFTAGHDAGNCGGGGGGSDGYWLTFSDSLVGAPAVVGGGGDGGAGSGTGTAGTAGRPGFGVHYTPSGVIIQNA